jgi:hypothetical protein
MRTIDDEAIGLPDRREFLRGCVAVVAATALPGTLAAAEEHAVGALLTRPIPPKSRSAEPSLRDSSNSARR